jgi:signal transduction histidine kinase/ActR/RegA family two-component response regulator
VDFFSEFAPHGDSYRWTPLILWVSVLSDLIIAISFISLPGILMYFARNREGLPLRWIFVVFGVFIVALAGGHAFQVWNTWHGAYGAEAIVKAITAIAAFGTATALWPLLRRTLELPSPRQLAAANESLRGEIQTRQEAERVLQEQARELGVARDAAQAANRAKSQFLTNMSHEIRTPLNAVIGFSEMLLHSDLSEEQRDHLHTVIDSGAALLAVVNDILDYSRIEAGKMELESVAFDLDDLLANTLRSLAVRADHKAIALSAQVDAGVPRALRGDPVRLRQVIANLVANAITFTEYGEVELRVACEPGGLLRFTVRDTGMGIDPADIDRLFESFEQADKSSSRRFGGTGLGLSISRGLVELLGGTIGAQSTPGAGSTFTFTARFGEPDAGDVDGAAQAAGSRVLRAPFQAARRFAVTAGREPERLAPQRILLVEDSVPNQKVALAMLQGQGHTVVVANDGQEALGLFGDREFDLILMDIQMPGMDGFECTAAIRSAEARTGGHIPIIALTAHALAGDREKCLAAGMDGYVSKPIRRDDLYRALTAAIRAGGAADLSGAPRPGGGREALR